VVRAIASGGGSGQECVINRKGDGGGEAGFIPRGFSYFLKKYNPLVLLNSKL